MGSHEKPKDTIGCRTNVHYQALNVIASYKKYILDEFLTKSFTKTSSGYLKTIKFIKGKLSMKQAPIELKFSKATLPY